MQTVNRFEANLLRLLYYFLGQEPAEVALPLVEERPVRPPCLSRTAVRLAKDALAKGCTFLLAGARRQDRAPGGPEARCGGWRVERHLRGDRVAEGRLWERTPPAELGLTFSRHTLAFLMWITAAQPGDKDGWGPPESELTPGDLAFLYFAHEALRESADSLGAPELRRRPPFVRHGLCWLAYPEDFTNAPADAAPDFTPWTVGVGACMLEALQPQLAERWTHVEASKARIADWRRMRELGRSQERVLTAFLDAVEAAGRLDLARFLLRAAAQLLGPYAEAGLWVGGLQSAGPRLADRADTYQAALAFVRQTARLQAWERRARTVGYFDEGYAAAQLWKADWEQYGGDALTERARAVIQQLDPMRQGRTETT
jgi:hypothetical protein